MNSRTITATTSLTAALGLCAWSMTGAVAVSEPVAPSEPAPAASAQVTEPAVAPAPAEADEPTAAPAEVEPAAPAAESTESALHEAGLGVLPPPDYDNMTCTEVMGDGYISFPAQGVWSGHDSDGDGLACEASGDDGPASSPDPRAVWDREAWVTSQPDQEPDYIYPDCQAALYFTSMHTFPADLPYSGPHLDPDGDGFACDLDGGDSRAWPDPVMGDGPRGDNAPGAPLPSDPVEPHDPWEEVVLPLPEGYEFPNCETAQSAGLIGPFPTVLSFAGGHLDPDMDFMACEVNGDDDAAFTGTAHEVPWLSDPEAPAPEEPESSVPTDPAPAERAPVDGAHSDEAQVEEIPVGGADTGAGSEKDHRAGLLVRTAVSALVVLGAAGLLIRRGARD